MISDEMMIWANDMITYLTHKNARVLKDAKTGGFDPGAPTQQDKPSPKSSLTKKELKWRLANFNDTDGFQKSEIANTNSMEPLLDDSDVVVLERLDGEWRAPRLKKQPFAPGQIVIYRSGVGRIIHTLKEPTTFLGKPAWVIQGFNNFLPDMAKILESQIVARVVSINYGVSLRDGD